MSIILLTHQRELSKPTNTGRLVMDVCADKVKEIVWARREPDAQLLVLAQAQQLVLLHPGGDTDLPIASSQYYVVVDATWQQAQKILNQSPYLFTAPKLAIEPCQPSQFSLRRNQRDNGLCTAEVVVELLRRQGHIESAELLLQRFLAFNSR